MSDEEHGYVEGPTVDEPWPIRWEQDPRIDDGHPHVWERCTLRRTGERFVRCAVCYAPRCGHSDDDDPCMERRHHDGLHITLGGSFPPVGGYLRGGTPQ